MELGRPTDGIRLVIDDYVGTPQERRRIKLIPFSQVFEIQEKTVKKWRKWLRKAWNWLKRHAFLSLTVAVTLLAQQLCDKHNLNPLTHLDYVKAAITSAISTSFKVELGTATHNFTNSTGDTFKVALFTSSATLGASTTAYATTNEITGTGYTAGGVTVTSSTPTSSGTTALWDFTDAQWTSATFTANGSQLYNSSKSNKSVFIIAFGSDQSVSSGTFTIQWPTPDASNAIIRF